MKFKLFGVIMSVFAYSGSTANVETIPFCEQVVEEYQSICIKIPENPLANKSLQMTTHQNHPYVDWAYEDRFNVFASLQKTVAVWREKGIADQYLVYGKQKLENDTTFNWEIVPYYKPSTIIGRIWQQFLVLWRIMFGGVKLSETQRQKQLEEYKISFKEFSPSLHGQAEKVSEVVNDAFCKPEVINRQSVLEGRSINVLYNYAPIGFGGERLHFLVVPKVHKAKFSELSEEEYLEATELTQKLITHFSQTRPIQDVYLFHKTGVDAGQTVPHWHMHMILISNKTQGFFGKLTVLKNMLMGSSPMKDNDLKEKVGSLRSELKHLQTKRIGRRVCCS